MRIRLAALALLTAGLLPACGRTVPGADLSPDLARILEMEDRRTLGDGALAAYLDPDMPLPLRVRAALALGRIGSPVAKPVLLSRSVADHSPELRRMAVFALGEMDDPAAVPLLVEALDDTDAPTRTFAAEALGKLKAAQAVDALIPLLTDRDEEVAGMTLLALWKIDPGESLPRQVEAAARLLSSASGELRRRAAYFLMRSKMGRPDDAAIENALLDAVGDPDPLLRSFVARGLGASKTPASTDALLELAKDPDRRVRINAFNGLGARPVDKGWQSYATGLDDADTGVRLAALASLATCAEPPARQALEEALHDDRARFREVALRALGTRDAKEALPLLEPLVSDPAWSVRARASEALALIGGSEVEPFLSRLAVDDDPRVRSAAVAAVAGSRTDPGRSIVTKALADDDLFVRAAALGALGEAAGAGHDDPESLTGALIEGYRRGAGDVQNDARLAALDGLGRTGTDRAREAIGTALDDADYLVRRRAAELMRDRFGVDRVAEVRGPEASRDAAGYLEAVRRGRRRVTATFDTDAGRIVVELLAADAPLTVDNFIRLSKEGRLDGLAFHRVVPNFVIQDGDPRGDGNGGPPWQIRCEINMRRYGTGTLGMALSGKDTGGSQYFMTHSPQPHLDGGYTVFGQVISGQEVVDRMVQGDGIQQVTIVEEPEP